MDAAIGTYTKKAESGVGVHRPLDVCNMNLRQKIPCDYLFYLLYNRPVILYSEPSKSCMYCTIYIYIFSEVPPYQIHGNNIISWRIK